MLKDNIKTIRKSKGLSQEELAIKLNVVRQTISKWEQGLSVPDSELLVSLSDALDTQVSTLLGENITEQKEDSLAEIAEKLEIVNLQLAQKKETKRKIWHWLFISICIILILIFISLATLGNAYMELDYNDPELAVLGVGVHTFVWIFVRIIPIALIGSIIGICLTRKKQ
ncbi:MAG TPA: helix-turn-helix domain-containing protein [Clostridiaceae bacterium]|nr:helix-turn-helix domain-containing protein [Clostridiaceae bacterium]